MTDQTAARKTRAPQSREAAPEKARRGRGRPVGDRDAKRAELLEAALAVIADEGYAAATLRKVAQRAGCTTGAVTYYFPSREEMMAAVVESRFDLFDDMVQAEGRRLDVRAGFQRWLDWVNAEDPGERLAGLELLAHARQEPALAAVYQRRYARYRDELAEVLARGQREGTVRDDIPAAVLSDQLCAMGDGWMMLLPVEPERFRPEWVQTLIESTMTLIAPPDAKKTGPRRSRPSRAPKTGSQKE